MFNLFDMRTIKSKTIQIKKKLHVVYLFYFKYV